MAVFTTWTALLADVRDALASRNLAIAEYRMPDGTFVKCRSLEELMELESWLTDKAAAETSGLATRRVTTIPRGDSW